MLFDPRTKPLAGALLNRAHPLARGLLAAYLLDEMGPRAYDATGRYNGTIVGTPVRTGSPIGPGLSGFTTSNYVSLPLPATIGNTYPFWMFAIYTSSSSTQGSPLALTNNTTSVPLLNLGINESSITNQLGFVRRDDANAGAVGSPRATLASLNDGRPHAIMGVSYSNSDHRLFFDGRQVATSTTTIGTTTLNIGALGARIRTSVDLPFPGTLIAAYVGTGSVPDPAWLAAEPFAMFGRSTPELFAYSPPFSPGWLARTPVLGSGVY